MANQNVASVLDQSLIPDGRLLLRGSGVPDRSLLASQRASSGDCAKPFDRSSLGWSAAGAVTAVMRLPPMLQVVQLAVTLMRWIGVLPTAAVGETSKLERARDC